MSSHFYHFLTIVRHKNSLICADVPLRNYSLTHSLYFTLEMLAVRDCDAGNPAGSAEAKVK